MPIYNHCSPLNSLNRFAQCVNSSSTTGSSDFEPDPKYLRVEIANCLCCFHKWPLLKPKPGGKHKSFQKIFFFSVFNISAEGNNRQELTSASLHTPSHMEAINLFKQSNVHGFLDCWPLKCFYYRRNITPFIWMYSLKKKIVWACVIHLWFTTGVCFGVL